MKKKWLKIQQQNNLVLGNLEHKIINLEGKISELQGKCNTYERWVDSMTPMLTDKQRSELLKKM